MSDFPQEFQEEESLCRSMHHLSTAAHHQPSAATNRPSHLSPSSSPEPSSKRLNVNPDSSPSAADAAAAGYTKLSLPFPISFPLSVAPWPLDSRTSSEPIKFTAAVNNVQQPSPKFSEVPTSSSPALNPSPPSFPFPSLCRKRKLKRILKECMKELSELVNQVVSEGDEEDSETENYSSDNVPKDES